MTSALTTAKRALRSTIKKSLSKIPAELVQSQSQTCIQTFLSLPEYHAASRLSVFLSMPGKEVDTSAIVEQSFQNGTHLARHAMLQVGRRNLTAQNRKVRLCPVYPSPAGPFTRVLCPRDARPYGYAFSFLARGLSVTTA
jgi:5-formyltetrahydrofolate cyclo-ligase